MTKRLSENDRRAVDLLLDRSPSAHNGNGGGNGGSDGYASHAHPTTEPGLRSAQKVLNLLDAMPAEEPPADLVTRTMAHISTRAGAAIPVQQPHATMAGAARPHA